ncbi:hypothetical protein HCH73_09260 [Citrobacter koseri]|uniref:hypothetical protein n=1 Tax=Citrobacter koseri TaxID=545 RepID=UPI0018E0EE30|nr:hypothetical protein [Citrobacter koseri]MBI0677215.1 hypothetical protein [Citrobacter koseri]
MSSEFLIFRIEHGKKMWLTSLPNDENPLGGIGFQGGSDGGIPIAAGSCPTEEDAKKVVAYLRESIGTNYNHFGIQEREAAQ